MLYKIVCDGACDLSDNYIIENNIGIVPCYCSVGNKSYASIELRGEEIYQYMIEKGKYVSTSMPNIQDYLSSFEENLKDNNLIVCICMSSKLSGSYQSAMIAKRILEEKKGSGLVYVIDSQSNTIVQGLVVKECVEMVKAQLPIKNILKEIAMTIKSIQCYFCIDEIKYLVKGGRARGILDICDSTIKLIPLLTVQRGEHKLVAVSRGNKKALKKMCKCIKKYFELMDEEPKNYRWCIGMGINVDDAIELKNLVNQSVDPEIDIEMLKIGAVVSAHTGPYLMGVAFVKKYHY